MATLADQIRQENAEKFEAIKQELTDKVVNDIRSYGESKVNTFTILERESPLALAVG